MSEFITYLEEDGAYALTEKGTILTYVLIGLFAILAVAGIISAYRKSRAAKQENGGRQPITTRQLVFSAVALAIAFPLSYVKIFHLPWGGSVTLCSMFFVTLIGSWYGAGTGFAAAFAYSLLQFIQGGSSWMLSPMQVGMDYLFAFTALGASGFLKGKKNGVLIGYLIAIFLRGLFHTIGGYLYWMDYMPDTFPKAFAFAYPVVYNYSYILLEGLLTVILLMLPPVRKALQRVENDIR